MSENQYHELQAIDRPLTAQQQATLRKYSSRATITSSRFAVDYSRGELGRLERQHAPRQPQHQLVRSPGCEVCGELRLGACKGRTRLPHVSVR
jgi:hypothetical protein